jgi:hypothetical protein
MGEVLVQSREFALNVPVFSFIKFTLLTYIPQIFMTLLICGKRSSCLDDKKLMK